MHLHTQRYCNAECGCKVVTDQFYPPSNHSDTVTDARFSFFLDDRSLFGGVFRSLRGGDDHLCVQNPQVGCKE
ncbi:hypothetical protein BaRGS_00016442, partial [Batillaria attramentaria]